MQAKDQGAEAAAADGMDVCADPVAIAGERFSANPTWRLTFVQFLIFSFISMEFGLYILIRQLVNGKEWLTVWRGKKGVLRKRLRAATTYEVRVWYGFDLSARRAFA
jgi:hypothetical protein